METEIKRLEKLGKIKLKQKQQWYCDVCGEIINTAKEGMLEWDSFLEEETGAAGYTAKNFRIIHHKKSSPFKYCQTKSSDVSLSDGHLHWFIGSDGLSKLLNLYDYNIVDHQELNEIIRRLHVDYYEEARPYMGIANEDQQSFDPYQVGDYSQADLLALINIYAERTKTSQ
ncbi:hypothetical protein RVS70_07500 [Virgibacillus sp. M23]|uniref:hypothetical protein n=1 Tax=Virgibacillus sp. M23 TaxID=3079030 RepID=UPI002A91EF4D|nr:hypothetical protein [Virgibacillus sp. M23]MDY7044050.1 hypothetical protein [Virgibacillus sp. M23]